MPPYKRKALSFWLSSLLQIEWSSYCHSIWKKVFLLQDSGKCWLPLVPHCLLTGIYVHFFGSLSPFLIGKIGIHGGESHFLFQYSTLLICRRSKELFPFRQRDFFGLWGFFCFSFAPSMRIEWGCSLSSWIEDCTLGWGVSCFGSWELGFSTSSFKIYLWYNYLIPPVTFSLLVPSLPFSCGL